MEGISSRCLGLTPPDFISGFGAKLTEAEGGGNVDAIALADAQTTEPRSRRFFDEKPRNKQLGESVVGYATLGLGLNELRQKPVWNAGSAQSNVLLIAWALADESQFGTS
ncbi:hypothetical protein VTI28DRAFT_8737 [Corynascus sepedonium]